LAEKELYIGDFYFKREVYDSAKPRYKKIVELYPETPSAKMAEEKLARIDLVTSSKTDRSEESRETAPASESGPEKAPEKAKEPFGDGDDDNKDTGRAKKHTDSSDGSPSRSTEEPAE
jgi:hypothetical protein